MCLISNALMVPVKAFLHRGLKIRDQPFLGTTDEYQDQITILSLKHLDDLFSDKDIRLVELLLYDGSKKKRRGLVLSYHGISQEASLSDHHPIGLLSHWPMSLEFVETYTGEIRNVDRINRKLFLKLIDHLKPAYGCITCEIPLDCPTDLRKGPSTGAFLEFYVSYEFLGVENVHTLESLFTSASREALSHGVYFSTRVERNPRKLEVDAVKNSRRSTEVGRIIGSRSRTRPWRSDGQLR